MNFELPIISSILLAALALVIIMVILKFLLHRKLLALETRPPPEVFEEEDELPPKFKFKLFQHGGKAYVPDINDTEEDKPLPPVKPKMLPEPYDKDDGIPHDFNNKDDSFSSSEEEPQPQPHPQLED